MMKNACTSTYDECASSSGGKSMHSTGISMQTLFMLHFILNFDSENQFLLIMALHLWSIYWNCTNCWIV